MTNQSEDAKKYELMVIISSDLPEEKITQKIEEIKKQITGLGGEIFSEDLWGMRDLAYKIKKQERGYYAVLYFISESEIITELGTALNLDKEILRHLLLIIPAKYEVKSFKEEVATANFNNRRVIKEEVVAAKEEKPKKFRLEEKKPEETKQEVVIEEELPVPKEKKEEVEVIEKKEEPQERIEEKKEEEEAPKEQEEKKSKAKKTEEIIEEEKKHKEKLDKLDDKLRELVDNPDIKID